MEPKDLKNSEELKSTLSSDAEFNNDVTPAETGSEIEAVAATESSEIEPEIQPEFPEVNIPDIPEVGDDVPAEEEEEEEEEVQEQAKVAVEPELEAAQVMDVVSEAEEVAAVAEEVTEPVAETVEAPVVEEVAAVVEETVAEEAAAVVEEVAEPVAEVVETTVPEETAPDAEPIAEVVEPVAEETATVAEEVAETPVAEEAEAVKEEAIEPVVELVEAPVAEEVAEPVAEAIEAPVAEETAPVAEPIAEVVASVAEEVAEPVAEVTEAPVSDEAAAPGEEVEHEEAIVEEPVDVDYASFSQIELINLLRDIVEGVIGEAGHSVDALVAAFYLKSKEISDEAKRKFLEEGGKPEEYVGEEDPYGHDIRELLKKYKQQKFEQSRKMDAEKELNLKRKYELIEDIKNLLNKEESINRTFQEFRELQKQWYEIGQVPQAKMKDLWDTYHFHVENFYDYIKINKELRDLDLRKNLEAKIELCENTEELLMEPSVIKAFNSLQKYHEEWREIGPVPTDKKDEIWERFKAATSKINQKHQDYFEKRKLDQKKNLDAKIALCEKAEEISTLEFDSHRDWDEKSRELVELQKVWKTIGFAPKKENNKVYDRFRAACDKFFINKREYYSKNKDIQQTNLQMKIDLCMEAETLKESTDWKKATQQFIDIQKRWKEIGPVPRKNSDVIWKRFRAACDFFFEKKATHFSDIDGEQIENLRLKEQLIEEVENFKPDNDPAVSIKMLRDYQRRWTEIGHVPVKSKDNVQHRFREAINKQFDDLKIDNSNRTTFNFRSKIESMTDNARGLSKVRSEREKYMSKLKQLETDLTLLDNNIGFFANSKNAQVLIADVNQKIVDTREKIEQLKEKIRIIDDLDKSDY